MTLPWPTLYDQEPDPESFAACNIGLAEWRRRRRILRLVTPLVLLGFLLLVVGPFGRDAFLAFTPAVYLWALCYLQVRLRHCAGFGIAGVVSLDPQATGRTGRAAGSLASGLRRRTLAVLLLPLAPAALWALAVGLLMPVCA